MIPVVQHLDIDALPVGTVSRLWVELARDGFGCPESVPILVARGRRPGPVVGLTAAVHGNELNGIPVLHRLFDRLDCHTLRGTVVGVVVANVPGFHRQSRRFVEGFDLNHHFPGREHGHSADVTTHHLFERVITRFDALLDLHTASFGRVNCLYVRADMTDPATARMAYLQRPQVIVHNPPADGTLRGAAAEQGIPAITVEIGDPHRFQPTYIKRALVGVRAVLMERGLLPRRPISQGAPPVLCRRSNWLYCKAGGLLTVHPKIVETVTCDEVVATLVDIFGDPVADYRALHPGIVIGRSVQPVARTGARILHLGELADETDAFVTDQPFESRSS